MATDLVDVEELVKRWAWRMFDATKTREQGKMPREQLQMSISWRKVRFNHEPPVYTDIARPSSPKVQCLFKTYFTNDTDQPQEYSFKTERVTRSTAEVEVEKGYCIGFELNVALKTPCEVFEANAGFKKELELVETHGESFEEELMWAVDSLIKVPPKHKTTAQLVISEDNYSGIFTVNSTFSGKVHASITNIKDNNSFVKAIDGNIVDIVKQEIENGLKGFVVERNKITTTTKGKCNFRFAIEQHVKLSQEALNDVE